MATERFYPATLENQKKIIEKLSKVLQPVKAPEHPSKFVNIDEGTITLTVQDPGDVTIGNITVARWIKTVIVKNAERVPQNPEDGILVTEWTVRNLHYHNTSSGYVDTEANPSTHYRAFAFAENGEWTASEEFHPAEILGFYIDTTDPNEETCVHYIRANEHYERAHMNFETDTFEYGGWAGNWLFDHFTPVMLGYDGEILEYLNPNDLSLQTNGNPSSIRGTDSEGRNVNGNAMMRVAPIYVKLYEEDGRQYALFSPEKLGDDWECWSAKLHDGSYAEFFALPLFEGSVINNRLRSLATGTKPTANTTAEREVMYAADNGANWYPTLWADEMLMRLLGVLIFGRLDSQKALGGTYKSGANALIVNCGSMTDKGMFWGASMLNADGAVKDTATGTKFFGMENWWCHRNRRAQGLNLVGTRDYRIKLTPSKIDGTECEGFITAAEAAKYDEYLKGGRAPGPYASGSPIVKMNWGVADCMTPQVAVGTTATYYCDNCYTNSGVLGFCSGGSCGYGLSGGLFCSYLPVAPSYSLWSFGASPSYHPF